MNYYLSYLMGAKNISDSDLTNIGVVIRETMPTGSRKILIPEGSLQNYICLVEKSLEFGFWNEIVGRKQIIFLFKFKDGKTKQYHLTAKNEPEIDKLCAKLNNETPDKTANVYKYLSENDYYRDFMFENYTDLINR